MPYCENTYLGAVDTWVAAGNLAGEGDTGQAAAAVVAEDTDRDCRVEEADRRRRTAERWVVGSGHARPCARAQKPESVHLLG